MVFIINKFQGNLKCILCNPECQLLLLIDNRGLWFTVKLPRRPAVIFCSSNTFPSFLVWNQQFVKALNYYRYSPSDSTMIVMAYDKGFN